MGLNKKNIPAHVAVIMDGNGRWAKNQGKPRTFGHEKGADAVRELITEARKIGVKVLTLYTFSSENWGREPEEVYFLMNLLEKFLVSELSLMKKNSIKFMVSGDLAKLPESTYKKIEETIKETKEHSGMILNLALSYGSRQEIIRAVKKIADDYKSHLLSEEKMKSFNQNDFALYLYTANLPDPDLMIRTGGEVRVSNFLLWQMAYTEMYFTDKMWPEFSTSDFHMAIEKFNRVERRFGLEKNEKIKKSKAEGEFLC